MKINHCSIAILALTLGAHTANAADAEIEELHAALTRQLAQLEPEARKAPPKKGRRSSTQQTSGLQGSKLTTGSLQPSSGLGSAAKGLSSLDDWRLLFPAKK